ncbi:hypothetical protein BKG82_26155 [Mycobacteroides chelonae]|uniref:Uncharacterized protein n=1 Tax=Mycobacteroides chelonae TaxID=1774 RepID=A0A1S1LKM2_MYCCH|nr:hypothetical protein [Mycobacteroides chelonae]OHU47144.1 hypothetical protein BKG82_26155 [Mycobacteroides chelonae]
MGIFSKNNKNAAQTDAFWDEFFTRIRKEVPDLTKPQERQLIKRFSKLRSLHLREQQVSDSYVDSCDNGSNLGKE